MGKALEWLGGSVLVYAVVAACGGIDPGGSLKPRPVVDSGAGTGGVMGAGGTAQDSGLADAVADALDAMVDPVPDADAQTNPPADTVVTAPCSSTLAYAGVNQDFAELSLPGRSAASLARTVALMNAETTEGYDHFVVAYLAIRDGGVAALCGTDETRMVTFIVPPA
jgi:hypothetical protein